MFTHPQGKGCLNKAVIHREPYAALKIFGKSRLNRSKNLKIQNSNFSFFLPYLTLERQKKFSIEIFVNKEELLKHPSFFLTFKKDSNV